MNRDKLLGFMIVLGASIMLGLELGFFGDLVLPFDFFQIIWLAVAVYFLLKGIMTKGIMSICLSAGFILYLFATEVYDIDLSFMLTALIAVGFGIGFEKIFSPSSKKYKNSSNYTQYTMNDEYRYTGQSSTNTYSSYQSKITVSFTEDTRYVNTDNLQFVDANIYFAEARLFLNQSQIQDDFATIKLNVHFASCSIFVPKTWRVVKDVNTFCGNTAIHGYPNSDAVKDLVIQGNLNFGNIEIIYI